MGCQSWTEWGTRLCFSLPFSFSFLPQWWSPLGVHHLREVVFVVVVVVGLEVVVVALVVLVELVLDLGVLGPLGRFGPGPGSH